MALRIDRRVLDDDISFFMDEVAERGGVVVGSTAGSGAAMDQSQAALTYAADPSGKAPLGVLLTEMVNLDLTKTHLNWFDEENQKGGKAHIMTRGWVVTNSIEPNDTPSAFAAAYVGNSGNFTSTDKGSQATPKVGRFLSTKDAEGYAKVEVSLPLSLAT